MFLESIKLHGFKAFAGKAEIKLHRGITGILGPNGCGKSNIADAIRWVLGEQSVKQLRGATMEDVIFKGTRDRKPLPMADVVLKINNESGVLGIDYSHVSVGRRLYRAGQSDYLLNKTPCRLKDVRNLFLDSGLGVQAYSTFERSMIDEILNDSSPRRRELFEEASGIMKYKVRKKEAMRKLDAANRDLERVSDLISEIEREVRSLSRQVGRAKRYRRLKEETRDLDIALGARLVREAEARRRELELELQETSGQETGLSAELRTGEAEAEGLRLKLLEVGEALGRARQVLADEKERRAERTQRSEVLAERREGLVRSIETLTREIESADARAAHLLEELDGCIAEVARLAETATDRKGELEREETAAAELDELLREKRAKQASLQQMTLDLREAASEKTHELARETTRLEEITRRRERLEADRNESSEKAERLDARVGERREELERSTAELRALREGVAGLEEERDALESALETVRERLRAREGEHGSASGRLETLEDLRKSYEGYDGGVRSLLVDAPDGVVGAVAECIDADAALTQALEAALGAAMQSVVVRDAAVALACIGRLTKAEQGRVTFCPISEMAERQPPRIDAPGRCLADEVRLRRPEAAPVIELLLGGVFIADTPEEARAASRRFTDITWVTPSGEAFHADRRISGGGPSIGGKLLSRVGEIDRLTERRAELEREIAEAREESVRVEADRIRKDETLAEQRAFLAEREAEHAEVAEATRHVEFELRLVREETRGLEAELVTLGEEAGATEARIRQWEAARDEASQAGEAHAGEWEQLAAEVVALEERREAVQQTVSDRRVAYVEVSAELKSAEARRDRLEEARGEAERAAGDRRVRIEEARTQIGEIDSERAELAEASAASRETIEAAEADVERLTNDEAECRNAWTERDKALRGVRERAGAAREAMHKLELELSSASGESQRIRDRLFRDYGATFLAETDARGLPLVMRQERRRVVETADARRAGAASSAGGDEGYTNGHGDERTRLSIDALRADPGTPDASVEVQEAADDASEAEGIDGDPGEPRLREEIVTLGPLPADPPKRYEGTPEDDWSDIVTDLREKLTSFGPVNEMAVEDYEIKKERFEFLAKHRDDLVEARNGLMETIRKVNREARERFLATFTQAQEHFKMLHEVLFPGGHAELKLEGDDPLEADIVMIARPKGKRVETIKLLSSGERALTAIALLFAVYMIKPSPFCLLDEVDAPLDDANIDRFVRLIRQFADRTQFIIITHNKRTMEACDTLYGVTMQEPGVSTLVSVRFHEGEVLLDGERSPEFIQG